VLAENLIGLTNVELANLTLLPFSDRARPYINIAEFPSLTGLRGQAAMQAEIIALRHQVTVFQRTQNSKRIRLNDSDRGLWVLLSQLWSGWRSALIIVKPETVIGWHRQGFRWYWRWKIRHGRPGRPRVLKETRNLIRTMSRENFFTVHTIWFEILFVFVVLTRDRRRVVHFNVTDHPTAEWTAQQMLEAFPFDAAPKYLLRDRDRIYGQEFRKQVAVVTINEVLSAPRSPWQRAYVERLIGSIRRECLDHVIVFGEETLHRTLRSYFSYYHRSRLHLSLDKDSTDSRCVQSVGRLTVSSEVGGLHHRYERVA
jgi:hypothetical protein